MHAAQVKAEVKAEKMFEDEERKLEADVIELTRAIGVSNFAKDPRVMEGCDYDRRLRV